jgi:hypothetical protein
MLTLQHNTPDVDVIIIERDDRTVAQNAPFIVSRETTILIYDENKDYQDKGLGDE